MTDVVISSPLLVMDLVTTLQFLLKVDMSMVLPPALSMTPICICSPVQQQPH